jgi:hypothetical protein
MHHEADAHVQPQPHIRQRHLGAAGEPVHHPTASGQTIGAQDLERPSVRLHDMQHHGQIQRARQRQLRPKRRLLHHATGHRCSEMIQPQLPNRHRPRSLHQRGRECLQVSIERRSIRRHTCRPRHCRPGMKTRCAKQTRMRRSQPTLRLPPGRIHPRQDELRYPRRPRTGEHGRDLGRRQQIEVTVPVDPEPTARRGHPSINTRSGGNRVSPSSCRQRNRPAAATSS